MPLGSLARRPTSPSIVASIDAESAPTVWAQKLMRVLLVRPCASSRLCTALPGAILSISPWIDIAMTSRTIDSNADLDKLLSRPLLEFFRASWLDGTGVEWNDPRVNLLSADLSGLPPIAVYYGTDELLAGEAFEFGLRASAANDIFLRPVPAGQHSFIIGAGRVPEVDHAVTEMGRWLRSKLRAA